MGEESEFLATRAREAGSTDRITNRPLSTKASEPPTHNTVLRRRATPLLEVRLALLSRLEDPNRRKMRTRLSLLAAAAVVGALGPACSSGRDAITIYSGRDEAFVGPLLERFSDESNVPIDVKYGDSADLALEIEQAGEATPADVFFSQSPGAVEFLEEAELLGALPSETTGKVDPRFASTSGAWVGVTARQRVLVYNEELVRPDGLPASVLDLTEEQFRGRVAVAPSNGSFQDFVTALRQSEGDEGARAWLEGMAENDAQTYADNSSIVDAVARGEIPMGLVNHYYNYRYLAEDPDAPSRNYVFPDGDIGSLLISSTVSILESSDDDRAIELVDFLLDEDAQRFFSEETFEYPLVEGVSPSVDLPPLENVDAPEIDIRELGDLETTVEMIAESGL
jgi:iron(III) transport system substrate-binding protein